MRRRWVGILTAAISCFAIAAWAQQGQPKPGPGSGVVTVQGTVDIGNSLAVRQEGDWKMAIANTPAVTIANTPAVSVAPPDFVKAGARYQIVWPSGETERIAAAAVGTAGWVRVAGPERWVNLAQARSVTTLP